MAGRWWQERFLSRILFETTKVEGGVPYKNVRTHHEILCSTIARLQGVMTLPSIGIQAPIPFTFFLCDRQILQLRQVYQLSEGPQKHVFQYRNNILETISLANCTSVYNISMHERLNSFDNKPTSNKVSGCGNKVRFKLECWGYFSYMNVVGSIPCVDRTEYDIGVERVDENIDHTASDSLG